MKILITGGAGFIGSHLSEYLLEQGHEVTIIDNLITGQKTNIEKLLSNTNFKYIESDIVKMDFSELPAFDRIYHLASPASPVHYQNQPVETLRTNAEGTYNVLEHMRKTGKGRFILASTSEVYGDPEIHPQKESYWGNVNSFGPRACYDEAKRYAEAMTYTYATKYNVEVRVARIFNTYGPRMDVLDGRVVSNFVTQALKKEPITVYGDGSQTRSLCYVSDMVKGLVALADTENINMEVINLGNQDERTVQEIAEKVKDLTKSSSEIIQKPIGADDPKKRKPDTSKAKSLLNWSPTVELDQGLRYTIEYFESVL
jgi:nucleoside-diphosphate-sugar epimerase